MAKSLIHDPVQVGARFGRWTVLTFTGTNGNVIARCDCGTEKERDASTLRLGKSKSCGCGPTKRGERHRASFSAEYKIWSNIKDRCTNPKCKKWPDYGGRGITMCDRWRNSFNAFMEDMGPRPSTAHSIDRRDNNAGAGYNKDNCRWATSIEQQANRRSTVSVTYQGEVMPAAEACRRAGMKLNTLYERMKHMPEHRWFEPVRPRSDFPAK